MSLTWIRPNTCNLDTSLTWILRSVRRRVNNIQNPSNASQIRRHRYVRPNTLTKIIYIFNGLKPQNLFSVIIWQVHPQQQQQQCYLSRVGLLWANNSLCNLILNKEEQIMIKDIYTSWTFGPDQMARLMFKTLREFRLPLNGVNKYIYSFFFTNMFYRAPSTNFNNNFSSLICSCEMHKSNYLIKFP